MKAIVRTMACGAAVCLCAARVWAADGVLIVQKVTTGSAPPQTHQIQIDAHRMRAESAGASGATHVFVFDGTREVMLMIDDAKKTYSEISKADVEALSSQMSAAMAQAQERMKNMPPEQRAQIEALMKGRMGGAGGAAGPAAPSKIQYKKVGTDTVGKWTCDKYEGSRDGQKVQELCTVDPKALGFTAADFGVTKDMAEFLQKLIPPGTSQAFSREMFHIGSPEEQGFSGIPVRSVNFAGGQTVTQEITDVHRQSFTDSVFQAPAGYQKQASPFGRGRGRQ